MSSHPDADEMEIEFPQANIVAAKAIGGALASTIGPTGMDSLLVSRLESDAEKPREMTAHDEYTVTSDGATLLKELPVQHPIAPIIKRIIGPERPGTTDVVGESTTDGISSTATFLAALLNEAESLLELGVHPSAIERGYRIGVRQAVSTLSEQSRPLDSFEDERDAAVAVARTAMTGNDVGRQRNRWAELAVDAVDYIGMPDKETLGVRKLSWGSVTDSRLVEGTVLDRNRIVDDRMPKRITDANVLVLSGYTRGNISDGMTGGLQDPNVQRDGERIEINSPDDVEKFDRVFSERRERIVAGLTEAGVDVVVTRLGISSEFQDLLVEHDIVGVRRVNRRKLTQLKRAIGATEVRDPTDVSPSDLGHVGVLEQKLTEKRRGRRRRRRILVFDGCCDPESVTVLLQGASGQTKDQAATTIRKGATATAIARGLTPQVGGVVPGGGAPEMQIATAVRGRATAEDSRSQLALEAFADATERLVFVLAKNSGLDPLDTVSELRARETTSDDAIQIGLNLPTGTVTDVLDAGILDPVATRMNCYETAVDVAVMILRVDDAIDAIATQTPTDPDDTIYDDEAEKHHEYLEEHDDTRWDV